MNEAESLAKLGQWFDRLNEIELADEPDRLLVNQMLDILGPLIVLLAFDFERHGLDATEVKVAAIKHNAYRHRHTERRLEVVSDVSGLCGRLLGEIERGTATENSGIAAEIADTAPADPWVLHCETMEAAGATHADTAKTWKATHPDCIETIEQLKKRSKYYRAERNRQRKAAGNPP